jgi:membrane-bound lytic murein transglycosylase D
LVGPVSSADDAGPSIARSLGSTGLPADPSHEFDAITLHPRVVTEAREMARGRGVTVRDALTRSGRYIDIIAREFSKEGVPPELAYLPAIESSFSHQAEGQGTVGLWQFTSGTARRYGLMVTPQVDERRDPELASRAAARLLRDLYDQFGRWGLVVAAYNAGPARVQQALDRNPGADLWQLLDRGSLPSHTKQYVPKVLAVAAIATEPKRFGLGDLELLQPLSYETSSVTEPMDVKLIASLCGCSASTIRDLNPALRRGVVPRGGIPIHLPDRVAKQRFEANYRAYKQLASR